MRGLNIKMAPLFNHLLLSLLSFFLFLKQCITPNLKFTHSYLMLMIKDYRFCSLALG